MSRQRVAVGVDGRGRPIAQWAEPDPADAPRYGHMEPAHTSPVERRKATEEELAAARARDEAAARPVLSLGNPRPAPTKEQRMIDVESLESASVRLSKATREATQARETATAAWLSAAVAESRARVAGAEFDAALEALQRVLGVEVPEVPVTAPVPLTLAPAATSTPVRPLRGRRGRPAGKAGADGLTDRQREVLDAVVAAGGSRRPAAEQLGMDVGTVEATLENIGKKRLLPATLIPLLPARFAKYSTVQA